MAVAKASKALELFCLSFIHIIIHLNSLYTTTTLNHKLSISTKRPTTTHHLIVYLPVMYHNAYYSPWSYSRISPPTPPHAARFVFRNDTERIASGRSTSQISDLYLDGDDRTVSLHDRDDDERTASTSPTPPYTPPVRGDDERRCHTPPPSHYIYYDVEDSTRSTFPTSSVRDEAFVPQHPSQPRYDPLRILEPSEENARPAARPRLTTYNTEVVILPEVSPGVLSDGTLTKDYPPVQEFLEAASKDPTIPLPTEPNIFALAALSVYYHPKRPAHWMFWNKDKRKETANIVHKVLCECFTSHPLMTLPAS